MQLSIRQQRIFSIVFFSFVLLAYLSPSIWYSKSGGYGTALIRDDEYSYSARILRVEQGYYHVGNPWSYDHRKEPSLIPVFPEWILGSLSKLLPLEFEKKILWLRALLVLFLFFSCGKFFEQQSQSRLIGTILAAWILTDPGLIYYKPLAPAFFSNSFLPLNRFTNPLFGLSVFFLTLYFVFRAFNEKAEFKWALLAGIFLASQFYISVYYWSHSCLWILIWAFFSPSPQKCRQLGIGILTTLILVIPYLWNSIEMRSHPVFSTIAWRNGLLLKERGWYLIGHKTLYFFLILSIWKLFSKQSSFRFLSIGVLTGGTIYFSSLATGITFQNFHWHYTLAPISFLLLFLSLPKKINTNVPLLIAYGILSTGLGFYSGKKEVESAIRNNKVGLALVGKNYEEAFDWIKKNSAPEDVILTGAATAPHIPLRTGRRVFYNTIVEFVPANEVLQYYQLYWFLHDWKSEVLYQKIYQPNPVLSQYEFGFTKAQEEGFRQKNFPPISVEIIDQLSKEVSQLQSQLSGFDLKSYHQAKRLNYIVLGPNETGWKERLPLLFQAEKVFQGESTEVYRVLSWKD